MAQLVAVPPTRSTRPSRPVPLGRPAHVAPAGRPAPPVPVVLVDDAPLTVHIHHLPHTAGDVAHAARNARTVRVGTSRHLPDLAAVRGVLRAIEAQVSAAGRARDDVRLELELEVVLVDDAAAARRAHTRLSMLDGLTGLGWAPTASRLIGVREQVEAEAARIGADAGVDAVVLVPLGR